MNSICAVIAEWLNCGRSHISIGQGWPTVILSGHVKYPDLTGMAQWHADLEFWSCDRSHMIGEVAGPDHGHQ